MNYRRNSSTQPGGYTLILGATGKTGSRIVERLTGRGIKVRLGSRAAKPSFDWGDQGSWDRVLNGVTTMYLSYAPDLAIPGATTAVRALVNRAVKRGVQRVVLLSGRGEEEAQLCENIVQQSGLEWTIVRASWFNQNFSEGEFLGMVLDGTIALPAGDVAEPFVDADDIADVAVAALSEDGHVGKLYEVTGPRLLTFGEASQEIGFACGRDIHYIQTPTEAFAASIAEVGMPDEIAWLLDYLFSTVLDGRNACLGDGVQRALGREPTDFADYARRVAATGLWDIPSSLEVAAAK